MDRSTREILRGSAVYLASTVLNSAAAFGVALLVSASFGKEGLGLFSVCLVLLLVGGLLSDLGLNTYVIRAFAGPELSLPVNLRSMLLLRLAASGAAAALVAAVELLFLPLPQTVALALGSAVIIQARSVSGILESVAKGRRRARLVFSVSALGSALQVGAVAFLLYEGGSIAGTFIVLAGVELVRTFLLMKATAGELRTPGPAPSLPRVRALLGQSIPFAIMAFLSLVGDRADIVLLAAFAGAAEAGLYSAADRFLMAGILVGYAVLASAFPVLSSTALPRERDRIARQTLKPFLLLSLAGSALLWFAAPLLIRLTFGFQESILLLRILLCALPAMVVNNVIRVSLFSFEKERSVVMIFAGASAANLLLNVLFIPRFGAAGSAVIAVATEYVIALMYGLLYGRTVLHQSLKRGETLADMA